MLQLFALHSGLENIGAFMQVKAIENELKNIPGCQSCQRNKILNEKRHILEAAFMALTEDDKEKMKTLLNTEKVCYYVKVGNQQELKCF